MKYPECRIAVYLICHALLFAANSSAQQSKGSAPPLVIHKPTCTETIRDNCLSAPRVISSPPPTYSEEARKAKIEGDCFVSIAVDDKGNLTDLHVIKSLGMGLDLRAIDAVRTWKFEPAYKNGKPVAAKLTVQVSFHL